MIGPLLQGRALFLRELVPLVDAHDAGERAGDVVQNLLDDGETYTQARHAARYGATQVVQGPLRYIADERAKIFNLVPTVDRCIAVIGEDMIARAGQPLDNLHRLRR